MKLTKWLAVNTANFLAWSFLACAANACSDTTEHAARQTFSDAFDADAAGPADTGTADSIQDDVPGGSSTGMIRGLSMSRPGDGIAATRLAARIARPTLYWRFEEPELDKTLLTRAQVTPELVQAYIVEHGWGRNDARIEEFAESGAEVIPIIGHGWTTTLPTFRGAPATPDGIGRENYLARQSLFTQAMVERYDGDGFLDAANGIRISRWQVENELNQAFLTAVLGWRSPERLSAVGSAWADWSYVTQILKTLVAAVRAADPSAQVMHNFHTDITRELSTSVIQSGVSDTPAWPDAISEWAPYLDVVGLDSYPNFYRATPVDGDEVGRIVEIATLHAMGKPIWVVETSYPSGPASLGYNESSQLQFMQQSMHAAKRKGADVYMWFGTQTADSHEIELTEKDRAMRTALSDAFDSGNYTSLAALIFLEQQYMRERFPAVFSVPSQYNGLIRTDGSMKPAGIEFGRP